MVQASVGMPVNDEIVDISAAGGPSISQTIMVSSLQRLLLVVPPTGAPEDYRLAVVDENVLAKQTTGSREWAFRRLRQFYGLDPQVLLFRALRDLWTDDIEGQPLLAMLCALARDPVLRASSGVILDSKYGSEVTPADFDAAIEETFPGRYKDNTRLTTAQKVASSWHQSGHLCLETRTRKIRCKAHATPADLAYALLLGHLEGIRGQALFETIWAKVLDHPKSQLMDLALGASQRGLLEFRSAGGVVDVGFRELLRPIEGEQGVLL